MKTGTESVAGSRILIVSTHSLFGHGVGRLLREDTSLSIVSVETDIPTAVQRIREVKPHVVILDTNDPHCDPAPVLTQVLRASQDVTLVGLNLSDSVACVCRVEHRTIGDVDDLWAILRPVASD